MLQGETHHGLCAPYVVLLSFFFFFFVVVGCSKHEARTNRARQSSAPLTERTEGPSHYYCPIHTRLRSPDPRRCNDCENALITYSEGLRTLSALHDILNAGLQAVGEQDYEKGTRQFERAVDTAERLDYADEFLSVSLLHLALSRMSRPAEEADYAEIASLLNRALRLRQQRFGSNDPFVAQIQTILSVVYAKDGKFAEARLCHRQALSIWESGLNVTYSCPMHPAVWRSESVPCPICNMWLNELPSDSGRTVQLLKEHGATLEKMDRVEQERELRKRTETLQRN